MNIKTLVLIAAAYELTVGVSEIMAGVHPVFSKIGSLPSVGKLLDQLIPQDGEGAYTTRINLATGAGGIAAAVYLL